MTEMSNFRLKQSQDLMASAAHLYPKRPLSPPLLLPGAI